MNSTLKSPDSNGLSHFIWDQSFLRSLLLSLWSQLGPIDQFFIIHRWFRTWINYMATNFEFVLIFHINKYNFSHYFYFKNYNFHIHNIPWIHTFQIDFLLQTKKVTVIIDPHSIPMSQSRYTDWRFSQAWPRALAYSFYVYPSPRVRFYVLGLGFAQC